MVITPVPVVPHMSVAVNDRLAVVADKSRMGYAVLAVVVTVPTPTNASIVIVVNSIIIYLIATKKEAGFAYKHVVSVRG